MAERERRKRKWDVPGDPATIQNIQGMPSPYGPPNPMLLNTPPPSNESVIAAASAAARINALLVAKGLGTKELTRDIVINDCKPEIRYQLTKGLTHEQIHKETGCTVVSKGRFKPPGDTSAEPALFLHLVADTPEALESAAAKIQHIMQSSNSSSVKVPVGIDPMADPKFPLIGKILGPKGQFVKHIANETGTKVQLKGRGSGYIESQTQMESHEPLYLHIIGPNPKSVVDAKALAESLIDHVKREYSEFLATKANPMNAGFPGFPGAFPPGIPPFGAPMGFPPLPQPGFPPTYPTQLPYGYPGVPPIPQMAAMPPHMPPQAPPQYPPPASYEQAPPSGAPPDAPPGPLPQGVPSGPPPPGPPPGPPPHGALPGPPPSGPPAGAPPRPPPGGPPQYPPPQSYYQQYPPHQQQPYQPPHQSHQQPYQSHHQQSYHGQHTQAPRGGSDRFDPRNPRFSPQDANFHQLAPYPEQQPQQHYQQYPPPQPAYPEEPPQKRRFQEKKEAPAVGPQLPSAEEIAAYALPEPSDLMPPPPGPPRRPNAASPSEGMRIIVYNDTKKKRNNIDKPTQLITKHDIPKSPPHGEHVKFDIFTGALLVNKSLLILMVDT
jgi:hypothetical protein